MKKCTLCPRECGVEREKNTGFCGAGESPRIARAALHMWEEPCISGRTSAADYVKSDTDAAEPERGSGAIFFCGCNLDCVFCQNGDINHTMRGEAFDARGIADIMLALSRDGAYNINLVTPTPHVDVIAEAIRLARADGLAIPVVYNTNAYEKVETLRMLDGLVDIYLPDLKYVTPAVAHKYSAAKDYFEYASKAVLEMQRQVGTLLICPDGMAKRGVLVRHLVLPGSVDEARRVLDFIAENLPKETYVSLMSQYVPCGRAEKLPPLDRRLLKREYERAVEYCLSLGLTNVFIQRGASAKSCFTPAFDGTLPERRTKH